MNSHGTCTPLFPPCSGLLPALEQQGFHVVGYGCTTCIGNSGELSEEVSAAISENGKRTRMAVKWNDM